MRALAVKGEVQRQGLRKAGAVATRMTLYLGPTTRELLAYGDPAASVSSRLEGMARRMKLMRDFAIRDLLRPTVGDWLLWMHALAGFRGSELAVVAHVNDWALSHGRRRIELEYGISLEKSLDKLTAGGIVGAAALLEGVAAVWALPGEMAPTERLLRAGMISSQELVLFEAGAPARRKKLRALRSGDAAAIADAEAAEAEARRQHVEYLKRIFPDLLPMDQVALLEHYPELAEVFGPAVEHEPAQEAGGPGMWDWVE